MGNERVSSSRVESDDPRIEKKGKSERGKLSPEVPSELKEDKALLLYEKAVKFLKISGLSDADAHEVVSDETNPYSLWFLDYLERWGKKAKPTKAEWKRIKSMKEVDRMIVWKSIIYPRFKAMVKSYGFNVSDYEDVMVRAFLDGLNYGYVEGWIGLVRNTGQTSERTELNAMRELNNLAGLPYSDLKKRVDMMDGANRLNNLGPLASEYYDMSIARRRTAPISNKKEYDAYADKMMDVARDMGNRFPVLRDKINEALIAFARLSDDVLLYGKNPSPSLIEIYMDDWEVASGASDDVKQAAGLMEDWQKEAYKLVMDFGKLNK